MTIQRDYFLLRRHDRPSEPQWRPRWPHLRVLGRKSFCRDHPWPHQSVWIPKFREFRHECDECLNFARTCASITSVRFPWIMHGSSKLSSMPHVSLRVVRFPGGVWCRYTSPVQTLSRLARTKQCRVSDCTSHGFSTGCWLADQALSWETVQCHRTGSLQSTFCCGLPSWPTSGRCCKSKYMSNEMVSCATARWYEEFSLPINATIALHAAFSFCHTRSLSFTTPTWIAWTLCGHWCRNSKRSFSNTRVWRGSPFLCCLSWDCGIKSSWISADWTGRRSTFDNSLWAYLSCSLFIEMVWHHLPSLPFPTASLSDIFLWCLWTSGRRPHLPRLWCHWLYCTAGRRPRSAALWGIVPCVRFGCEHPTCLGLRGERLCAQVTL